MAQNEGDLMKKVWIRPELKVLVRRKSDEVILTNCSSSGGFEASYASGCNKNGLSPCTTCYD